MKGGGRFKLVHSKGRISNRGGGEGKKGGRNGNENTRHKFDARDGVSRQNFSVSKILWWLVLGSVCYRWAERSRCDIFQVKYRNNHWKHDLYVLVQIEYIPRHWVEGFNLYLLYRSYKNFHDSLERNRKILRGTRRESKTKYKEVKDSFWFRPRIQYTLTLSQVSLVRCKHPQILPFNISSYTQTDFPLFRIDRKFFVRFRN